MRAIFFILVGIGLTLATIHYMGPDRFMKLYQGIVSTGGEIAAGGGIDTINEKLNAGGAASEVGTEPARPTTPNDQADEMPRPSNQP